MRRDQVGPSSGAGPGTAAEPAREEPPSGPPAGRVDVSASLTPAQLSVDPGSEATCEVLVRNLGTVVDRFQLEIQGEPGQWSLIEPATLSLFPDTESSAVIRFRPPRTPRVPAGRARFRVKTVSSTAPEVLALVEGMVDVQPYSSLEARIMPQTSGGPQRAEHRLIVDNQGNAQVRVVLQASDPDGVLDLRVDPPVLTVEAGASAVTAVGVVARQPVLGGLAQSRPFAVKVEVPTGAPLMLSALFVQEPLPPPLPQQPAPPAPAPLAPTPPRTPAPQAGQHAPAPRRGLGAGGCLVLLLLVPLLLLGGLIFGLLAYTLVTEGGSYYNAKYLSITAGFFVFTVLVLLAIRWVWRRSRAG